jgi:hypothetical protein
LNIAKRGNSLNEDKSEVVVTFKGQDIRLIIEKKENGYHEITAWRDSQKKWHPIDELADRNWESVRQNIAGGKATPTDEFLYWLSNTQSPQGHPPYSAERIEEFSGYFSENFSADFDKEQLEEKWLQNQEAVKAKEKAESLLNEVLDLDPSATDHELNDYLVELKSFARLELADLAFHAGDYEIADTWSSRELTDPKATFDSKYQARFKKIAINLSQGKLEEALRQLKRAYDLIEQESNSENSDLDRELLDEYRFNLDGIRAEIEFHHAMLLSNSIFAEQDVALDLLLDRFGDSSISAGDSTLDRSFEYMRHVISQTGRVVWNVAGRAWTLEDRFNGASEVLAEKAAGAMVLLKALERGYTYAELLEANSDSNTSSGSELKGLTGVIDSIYPESSLSEEQKEKLIYALRTTLENFDIRLVSQLGILTEDQQNFANNEILADPDYYKTIPSAPYGYLRAGIVSSTDLSGLESSWGEAIADFINVPNYLLGRVPVFLHHTSTRAAVGIYRYLPRTAQLQLQATKARLTLRARSSLLLKRFAKTLKKPLIRFTLELGGGELIGRTAEQIAPGLGLFAELAVDAAFLSPRLPSVPGLGLEPSAPIYFRPKGEAKGEIIPTYDTVYTGESLSEKLNEVFPGAVVTRTTLRDYTSYLVEHEGRKFVVVSETLDFNTLDNALLKQFEHFDIDEYSRPSSNSHTFQRTTDSGATIEITTYPGSSSALADMQWHRDENRYEMRVWPDMIANMSEADIKLLFEHEFLHAVFRKKVDDGVEDDSFLIELFLAEEDGTFLFKELVASKYAARNATEFISQSQYTSYGADWAEKFEKDLSRLKEGYDKVADRYSALPASEKGFSNRALAEQLYEDTKGIPQFNYAKLENTGWLESNYYEELLHSDLRKVGIDPTSQKIIELKKELKYHRIPKEMIIRFYEDMFAQARGDKAPIKEIIDLVGDSEAIRNAVGDL